MLQKIISIFFRFLEIILLSDSAPYILFILLSGAFMMEFVDRSYVYYTPWVILLIFVILIAKIFTTRNWNFILILSIIGLMGFLIEVIGVETKIIFGTYYYGDTLGIKLLHVPLVLGINWIIVAWGALSLSYILLKNFKIKFNSFRSKFLLVFLSSIFTVLFDFVLEPVAISLGFWFWSAGKIPLQNYLAWFLITFFFNTLIILFAKNELNKILLPTAAYVFVYFGLFFLMLNILKI